LSFAAARYKLYTEASAAEAVSNNTIPARLISVNCCGEGGEEDAVVVAAILCFERLVEIAIVLVFLSLLVAVGLHLKFLSSFIANSRLLLSSN
jgi:hypothetical protein